MGVGQRLIICFLIIVIVGCDELVRGDATSTLNSHDQSSSYEGSQAYNNSSLFTPEDVNNNSGSLNITRSLVNVPGTTQDISLFLNLIYSTSTITSTFHMPKGWRLQLSYVIPDKSVNIDGRNYLIDYTWSDNSGYRSGLKYMNNHSVHFANVGTANLKCKSDNREYHYIYSDTEGGHQYFDTCGRLIVKDNTFGSCISYYYQDGGTPYDTRLDKIIDSYGQEFNFHYNADRYFTVNSKNKQLAKVYYDSDGVSLYEDAMGYKTYYNYTDDDNPLINQINYPSGLTTEIQYSRLPYKSCFESITAFLPVVSSLIHTEGNSTIDQTDYAYGDGTGGHNFTGYGNNYCLGGDRDNLIEGNDYNYLYDTTITKHGDKYSMEQRSRLYYDFLHLAVEKDDLDSSNRVKNQVRYTYDISPEDHLRSASFGQPVKLENKSEGVTILLVNNKYNKDNRLIYSSTQALINGKLTAYKNSAVSYFKEAGYLPREKIENDQINGDVTRTVNTLNENKTAIASSSNYHNNNPWKFIEVNYDDFGRVTTEKISWLNSSKQDSNQASYTYSYMDGVLTTVKTDGMNNSTTVKTSTLLPGAPILQKISPLGNTTNYTYDNYGREVSKIDPMGYTTRTNYTIKQVDGSNTVVKTNPLGYTSTVIYDALGRVVVEKDNGGANGTERIITTCTYAQNNQLATKTDRFGHIVTNNYDEFTRLRKSTDALNNIATLEYDDTNLTTETYLNKRLKNKIRRDPVKNSLSITNYSLDSQHNNTVEYNYNGFGQKLSSVRVLDGMQDAKVSYTYNGDGEVINTDSTYYDSDFPINTTVNVSSNRDLLGNILEKTTTVSGKGTVHSNINTYNKVGQVVSITNPLGQIKVGDYDRDGRLVSIKDYSGLITSYTYDRDGNPISAKTGQTTVSSVYDAVGHLLSVSGSTGTIKYSYTKAGSLEQISYPDGKTIRYTYNNNGLLISKTNTLGVDTKYTYDEFGRLLSISMANSTLSYKYDDNNLVNDKYGELVETVLTNSNHDLLSHSYKYDLWGNMSEDNISQNGHYIKVALARNHKQKLISKKISSNFQDLSLNMTQTFKYDVQDHLLNSTANYKDESGKMTEVKEQFDYDANGNVLTYNRNGVQTNYSYNQLDQLTMVNDKKIIYDKAGNMLVDQYDNQYSYNELDQLTLVKVNNRTIRYNYWPTGLLREKTNDDNDDYVQFYYDGEGNANAILSKVGKISNQDSFMLDTSGKPIASYRNSHANYYLKDAHSTIAMLNQEGVLTNIYKYDAYGVDASARATDPAQSFLWDQEYKDEDTDLIFLRNRFFNTKSMRFMSADTYPVDNIYNFGNGDPINNTDPSGHMSTADHVGYTIAAISLGVLGAILGPAVGGMFLSTAMEAAGAASVTTGVTAGVAGISGIISGAFGAASGFMVATAEVGDSDKDKAFGIIAGAISGFIAGAMPIFGAAVNGSSDMSTLLGADFIKNFFNDSGTVSYAKAANYNDLTLFKASGFSEAVSSIGSATALEGAYFEGCYADIGLVAGSADVRGLSLTARGAQSYLVGSAVSARAININFDVLGLYLQNLASARGVNVYVSVIDISLFGGWNIGANGVDISMSLISINPTNMVQSYFAVYSKQFTFVRINISPPDLSGQH